MPSWDDYKKSTKSRGALALELYVVESTPKGDPELVQAALPNHLAYPKEREVKGALVLAGPQSDDTCDAMQGGGLIDYRARSFEDARSFAEADPMHKSGVRSFKLRRWLVDEGSLNMTLSVSDQRRFIS